jgi:hypothetical protein
MLTHFAVSQDLPLVATMRLISYLSTTLPLFLDIQEEFGKQVPNDLLVSIALQCKPKETSASWETCKQYESTVEIKHGGGGPGRRFVS